MIHEVVSVCSRFAAPWAVLSALPLSQMSGPQHSSQSWKLWTRFFIKMEDVVAPQDVSACHLICPWRRFIPPTPRCAFLWRIVDG
jgi:hypothetical protein